MEQSGSRFRGVTSIEDTLVFVNSALELLDARVSLEDWRFYKQVPLHDSEEGPVKTEVVPVNTVGELLPGNRFLGRGIIDAQGVKVPVSVRFEVDARGEILMQSVNMDRITGVLAKDTGERESTLRRVRELAAGVARVLTLVFDYLIVKPPKHSVLELQGLGKEIWEGIDPQEYVDRERAAWRG